MNVFSFCQKKKLKKPKENANYLCRHSVIHLSLETMGRGPIQVASHQEHILNFRTSLLKYKNEGFSWWQIPLWKKSNKSRNATCRVILFFEYRFSFLLHIHCCFHFIAAECLIFIYASLPFLFAKQLSGCSVSLVFYFPFCLIRAWVSFFCYLVSSI